MTLGERGEHVRYKTIIMFVSQEFYYPQITQIVLPNLCNLWMNKG